MPSYVLVCAAERLRPLAGLLIPGGRRTGSRRIGRRAETKLSESCHVGAAEDAAADCDAIGVLSAAQKQELIGVLYGGGNESLADVGVGASALAIPAIPLFQLACA